MLHIESVSTRSRRAVRLMGEIFGLATLFALSVEAACRVEDWVQFRTPIFALERSQVDLLVRDTLGMHGRPGGRFQKWSLNSFGMRGPEVPLAKQPHLLRVVTAGASETFGLYESPGREYPRQLEDTLNAHLAGHRPVCANRHAQVLNAAMPGMSLPTVEQDIRLRVRPLKPDVVVLYATPSTYLYDDVPVAARPDSESRTTSGLPRHNALFPRVADRLRNQIKSLMPSALQDRIRRREIGAMIARHPPNWRFDGVPVERLEVFEADLRRIVGTIRSIGAIPVVMTHGNRFVGSGEPDQASLRMWEKFYPRAPGQTIVAFDSAARLATMRVARDSQAVLVDLATTLSRSNGAAFADYSHFTDLGGALVAGTVSTSVLAASEGLITRCESDSR